MVTRLVPPPPPNFRPPLLPPLLLEKNYTSSWPSIAMAKRSCCSCTVMNSPLPMTCPQSAQSPALKWSLHLHSSLSQRRNRYDYCVQIPDLSLDRYNVQCIVVGKFSQLCSLCSLTCGKLGLRGDYFFVWKYM